VAALLAVPAEAAAATKELLQQAAGSGLAEQAERERRAQIGRLTALARAAAG
jgi:hypothetical protein